jgi:hypothetical protein
LILLLDNWRPVWTNVSMTTLKKKEKKNENRTKSARTQHCGRCLFDQRIEHHFGAAHTTTTTPHHLHIILLNW